MPPRQSAPAHLQGAVTGPAPPSRLAGAMALGCGPAGGRALGGGASCLRCSPFFAAARRLFFEGKRGADGRISGLRQPSGGLQVAGGLRKRHSRAQLPRPPQRPRPPPTSELILPCPCAVQNRAIEGQKLRLGGDALRAEPTYLLYLQSRCRRRLGSLDFDPASAQAPATRPSASSSSTALGLEDGVVCNMLWGTKVPSRRASRWSTLRRPTAWVCGRL